MQEKNEVFDKKKIQCLSLTANQANRANVALPTKAPACRTLIWRTTNFTNLHEYRPCSQVPACLTPTINPTYPRRSQRNAQSGFLFVRISEIRGRKKKIQCLSLTANQANQANVALPTKAPACRTQNDNLTDPR